MYNCTNTETEDVSPLVLCCDAAPIVPIEMTIVGCLINLLAIYWLLLFLLILGKL